MGRKRKVSEERPKEAPLPDENTVVCVVEKILGGDHFLARCVDGTRRVTRIPGRYRRRLWIKEGDIVLVAPWEMKPESRGDLIYRYTLDEARKLVEKGVIPSEVLEGEEL